MHLLEKIQLKLRFPSSELYKAQKGKAAFGFYVSTLSAFLNMIDGIIYGPSILFAL